MPSANSLDYKISLDAESMIGQFGKLLSGLNGLRSAVFHSVTAFVALRSAFGSVQSALSRMQASLDTAGGLVALSRRTGESVANLVVLQRAFRDAGLGAEMVGPALNLMQRALSGLNDEGQPTNRAIARLGLELATLRGQSPTAQLLSFGAALRAIQDPAERSALAMLELGSTLYPLQITDSLWSSQIRSVVCKE